MPPKKKRRRRPARPEPDRKEPAGDPEQRGKTGSVRERKPTRPDPKEAGESGPDLHRVI